MSEQLRKIMHGHSSSDSSPNTSPVVVKNEMDIVNYAENNQMEPTEVYYGRSSYRYDSHFNNSWEKINHAGRWQGYKNKTHSSNKKKLNPLDRAGNITVSFNCGCRFHWSYGCPYVHSSRNKDGVKIEEDFSVLHMVLMSQQKHKNGGDIFGGETPGSAVLDSGASSTVCGTKWYKCFLETLTDAQKKKIVKIKGEPLNSTMEINWTRSTRWFYHVLSLILKLVLSLMLWTLTSHFSCVKTPWKWLELASILKMILLQC